MIGSKLSLRDRSVLCTTEFQTFKFQVIYNQIVEILLCILKLNNYKSIKMKKIFITYLFVLIQNNLSHSQFEAVKNFQKELIKNEITGSNIVMIYKEGEVVFLNAENSNLIGDKKISYQSYKPYKETLFPIWSMSKPITIVGIMILISFEVLGS